MNFDIIYEDEHFLAINKPFGILVHRSPISEDKVFILQLLRDQVGYRLYMIHRLDRGTSGILLFAKYRDAAGLMSCLFMNHHLTKSYLAVVRGWVNDIDEINYPLADPETGRHQPLSAVTLYRCLARSEIDEAIGLRYATARFSLVEVQPTTGRRHQIRKHFAHISHPVIGDKKHGDVKHNNYFRNKYQMHRMLLHASALSFQHPVSLEEISIVAAPDEAFYQGLKLVGLKWP